MTAHRLVFDTGEQVVDEDGHMLVDAGYDFSDMQFYRVTGAVKNPREAFKTITLEAIKCPIAKVG